MKAFPAPDLGPRLPYSVLGPTSRFAHLQKYYSVQYFSPTYISLLFENVALNTLLVFVSSADRLIQQSRTLSILWTPEQNFVLSFGGFAFKNAHYFEFMLNTQRNMKELLEVTLATPLVFSIFVSTFY